jgi:HTH-type transcriptional regulator, glycine betaine synthesis regulator
MPVKPKYYLGQPPDPEPELDDFQRECVAIFQRAAAAFSLAPSIGQVYGLLFSTEEPLSLDQIMTRLGTSRGGTFQSVRWLRQIGAVERIFQPGQRKEFHRAVLNLRKLAGAFVTARINPHVESGHEHLERLRASIASGENSTAEFQRQRYDQMERWHRFLGDLLPFIKTFAEKF